MSASVAILTSSSGLGSFVPAVTLSKLLQKQGFKVTFHAIEQLYSAQALERFLRTQAQCQKNLRIAMLTQKWLEQTPQSINDAIDTIKLAALVRQWQNNNTKKFILFSGFWTSLLNEAPLLPDTEIEAMHLDVGLSLSWKNSPKLKIKHNWLLSSSSLQHLVPPTPNIVWQQRLPRVALHGGGWDIGNIDQYIPQLRQHFTLLINDSSLPDPAHTDHRLISDPSWLPWQQGCTNNGQFPPQYLRVNNHTIEGKNAAESFFQQQLSNCLALVTKPGGASLIDSFATSTPLVLLPPFGDYEKENGTSWIERGFALSFEDWQAQGFSLDALEKCHHKLLHASTHRQVYGECYANQYLTKA